MQNILKLKSISLFGQTIKIIYQRTLIDKQGAFGIWDYKRNTIYIQKSTRKHKLNIEQIESTLYHELIHACLDLMGYHKISDNEEFVTGISNLIHQIIKQIDGRE